MNNQSQKPSGTRLCLALNENGLTAYGNAKAFKALAEKLLWLSGSQPEEHYECHATMALEDDASRFEGKRPRNVWALVSKKLRSAFPLRSESVPGLELTFMMVAETELDQMAENQETGILPE